MHLTGTDRQAKINLIEQWKQSGLSQKQFYQQQKIPAHVFYYWHKCYRNQQHKSPSSASGGFIPLQTSSYGRGIEVQLPNAVRVVFNEQVSVDFLKALIG